MTGAPNFGTKFGRRRPCPRYGVPSPRPPQDPHPTNPSARTTRPSSISSAAKRNPLNDREHPAPIPRPTVPRKPRSPVPPPGWFPKEGPKPFLWSFQGGSGREIRNPSQNLSWEARGDILLIRKEYPLASRRSSSALPAGCSHPALWTAPQGAAHQAMNPHGLGPGQHPMKMR